MKDVIGLYNKKRSVFARNVSPCSLYVPLKKDGNAKNGDIAARAENCLNQIAVVIPACNEYPLILDTFGSIENSGSLCTIVCVVNNHVSDSDEIKENNRLLMEEACVRGITVLDASSKGVELSENEGVGTARRIGMDYALKAGAQVIACMDADTLVCSSYTDALQDFRQRCTSSLSRGKNPPAGAVTRFLHQKAENAELQKAIDTYEFFIKEHSRRLLKTGTPFYPYALGPSIVCSAWGYAASGGMPKRIAGEDFYFLQALIKLSVQHAAKNVEGHFIFPELDCTVFPQARLSDRTLFGTGQKLGFLVQTPTSLNQKALLYPPFVYKKIEDLIALFSRVKNEPENFLLRCSRELPDAYEFLKRERFFSVWDTMLMQNRKDTGKSERAFHIWFDGLKILRFIHYLTR